MSKVSQELIAPRAFAPDPPAFSDVSEMQDLTLRQLVRVVQRQWRMIVLTTCLISGFALTISVMLRSYFSSSAIIEVQKQASDPLEGALGSLAGGLSGGDDTKTEIQTQVAVLQSDALGIEAIERTGYEEHLGHYWRPFASRQRLPQEAGLLLKDAPAARTQLLKEFAVRLAVTPVPNTRLIQVTFEDPDPRYAASVTNTLIDQYVKDMLARRNANAVQASDWMTGQIADLNRRVQKAQENLIEYQQKSGLVAIPTLDSSGPGAAPTVHNPVLDRLVQLNQDLVNAQSTRIRREAVYRLAKAGDVDALTNMAAGGEAGANGESAADPGLFGGLMAMRQQQVALRLQLTTALQTMGAKNPHLIDLDRQLASINEQMKEEVQRIVNRTELDYGVARKAEEGLRSAYSAQEAEANKSNDAQIRLAVLQQEAESTRKLYEDLYTKLQESKLQEGTQSSNISIVSGALAAAKPLHPRKLLNTLVGLTLGLVLGIVLAFVRDNLDDSIVTSTEIENLTRLPVLGNIPSFAVAQRKAERRKLPAPERGYGGVSSFVLTEPNSPVSEAYRALRTAILLSQAGSPPRTMLITSCLPSEGKTTTTYNLAACFAQMGTRVLIIDADLRKPALQRYIPGYQGRGFSSLLTCKAEPADVIHRSADCENLHVLAAGPVPPNPAELLSSQICSDLLARFANEYELVFVDSPPSMLVADSAILSVKVDAVLVVARSGSTTRPALVRTVERFQRQGIQPRGLILNAVNTYSAEYYYTNGYYGESYYQSNA